MIVYESSFWGLNLLTRAYGSAFPRAVLFGALSASLTAALYYGKAPHTKMSTSNPFAYQIFAFVVGFALVFRSSLSYNRFWEARTCVQTMMGRLTYFTVEVLAEDIWLNHEKGGETPEAASKTIQFYQLLIHYVSLLFALMLKTLRKDFDLDDMYEHQPYDIPPALDAAQGKRGWLEIQGFLLKMVALDFLDWGDMKMDPKLPVIGGIPMHEQEKLGNPIDTDEMKGKGKSLQGTRPLLVYTWISKLLMQRLDQGGLRGGHGPITARQMGTLQEAMAAFGQAVKLSNTQFPFPWAQVVMSFQVIMAITLPFIMVAFMNEGWVGIMMTWVVVTTYCSINEVAAEMEDPYGLDPNDLPMERFVYDFNQGLCSACWQLRPEYFSRCKEDTKNYSFQIKNMKQAISLVVQMNRMAKQEAEQKAAGAAAAGSSTQGPGASVGAGPKGFAALAMKARGQGTKSPATVMPAPDDLLLPEDTPDSALGTVHTPTEPVKVSDEKL